MSKLIIKKGSAKFIRAYDDIKDIQRWWVETPSTPGIAFVGRSNVGKSSLINSMFGRGTAKTSKTPGRTQKVNIFTFVLENDPEERRFYLYDLPGYGHAKVTKAMKRNWNDLMTQFFMDMNQKSILINIQDARHPNQEKDQDFYDYIDSEEVPIILAFNKIDKLKKQKERAVLNKLKPQILKDYPTVKNIHYVSAEKKDGLIDLESDIVDFILTE
jgi:GTP-binding protein